MYRIASDDRDGPTSYLHRSAYGDGSSLWSWAFAKASAATFDKKTALEIARYARRKWRLRARVENAT